MMKNHGMTIFVKKFSKMKEIFNYLIILLNEDFVKLKILKTNNCGA